MTKYKKYWPVLLLLLIWLTLFRQFFFKGLLPIPADITVGVYYPWLDYKWGFSTGVPVKNPLMSDIPSLLYPWRSEVVDQFKSGSWPLWNPYYFMGMPLLANFQSGTFSYVNIFYTVFSKPIAWSLGIISSPLLTMLFMYWFLRRKKLSDLPALLGSTAFALSGFQIAWLEYNVHGHTALFLPIILLLADYWFESKKTVALLLVPPIVAMQIFSGYIPIVIYSWLIIGLYLFSFRVLPILKLNNIKDKLTKIKDVLFFGVIAVWGFLISAIQLLPGIELTNLSIRKIDPIVEASNASYLPLKNLLTAFAPDLFGNPATANYYGIAFYDNYYFFIGTLTILFVLFSLYLLRKNPQVLFFAILLVISIVMVTDNPIGLALNRILLLNGGVAARALFITDFSLAVLAGFGAEWMLTNQRYKKIAIPILIWGLFGLATVVFAFNTPDIANRQIAIRNIAIPGTIMVMGMIIILIPRVKKTITLSLLILVSVLQLLYSANKYLPFSKKELVFPSTPVIDFLQKQKTLTKAPFRVELGNVIPQNMLMPYKIETTSGYDALLPKINAELLSMIEQGKVDKRLSRVWLINNYDSQYFPLTNTKYILAKKTDKFGIFSEEGKPPERFNDSRYRLVFEDKTVQVYEDTQYLDRLVFIDQDLNPVSGINWNDYTNNRLKFDVNLDRPASVRLSMFNYPGWNLYINNTKTPIIVDSNKLINIPLNDEQNTVELLYNPPSFKLGLWVSTTFIALWVLSLLTFRKLKCHF